MTIRQLEYFQEVARRLNFSAAAEALYISQPALSRSIAALEQELGVQLLQRSRHRVTLTYAGMTLLAEAGKLRSQLDRSVVLVQQASEGMNGRLAIGVQQGVRLPEPLSEALGYMRRELPYVELRLRVLERGELDRELRAGELDMICCWGDESGEGVEQLLLERQGLYLAGIVEGRSGETLLCVGNDGPEPRLWQALCREKGTEGRVELVKDTATQQCMIGCGWGVGIFPEGHEIFTRPEIRRTCLKEQSWPLLLRWRRGNANPSANLLAELVKGDL